jgi:hypothetical protein
MNYITSIVLVILTLAAIGAAWLAPAVNSEAVAGELSSRSVEGNDTVPEMVGNPDLDESRLPADVNQSLQDINKVVSSTGDCSAASFKVIIPVNWQCRKLDANAQDVTLYTDNNTLNATIGTSQGMSSCSVIPMCSEKPVSLSKTFTKVTEFTQPMTGSVEIVGTYRNNEKIKVLVTSNDKPTAEEVTQIEAILDSIQDI